MIFTLHIASRRHLCKYDKGGKWVWSNGRTQRSGQLWPALNAGQYGHAKLRGRVLQVRRVLRRTPGGIIQD